MVATLGFRDRREAEGQPAATTSDAQGTASPLEPSASASVSENAVLGPSVQQLPVAAPTEYEGVTAMFRDAQARAAEQRQAAERVLEEARALESRITEEAEHLRAASALAARRQPLVEAVERASGDEQALLESVRTSKAKYGTLAEERKLAESDRDGLLVAEESTTAEVTRLEALLVSARRKLADVTTAVASATAGLHMASSREEAARDEAAAKEQALVQTRQTREEAEAALQALNEQSITTNGNAPSLFEEQLRTLEARITALSSSTAAVTPPAPTPAPVSAMSTSR